MAFRYIIQVDRRDSKAVYDVFERLRKTGRNLRRPLGRIGLFIMREARRALRTRTRDWGPPTGRLPKSLAMRVDDVSVVVGSNLVYAAIQQLGGEVKPKGHKYLAIPVQRHLRRAGVWPRDLPQGSMKFVPNASIRVGSHSWTGPALVRVEDTELETPSDGAGVKGKGKQRRRPVRKAGEVMFALVKRVRIRGRPYLEFGRPARVFALAELEREYRRAIGG
ncbi:MAG: hypothetical protein ABII12_03150 [Planctomycetota bacterium]